MTTIEKNIANDPMLREKVMDILPYFSGTDFQQAQMILDALKYILIRNTVFDYNDAAVSIRSDLNDLAAKI